MGRYIDLTGETFGRLRVLGREGINKHGQLTWACECECGNRKVTLGMLLRKGQVQSCGCLQKEITASINKTHGKAATPIYYIWRSMMDRCHAPKSHAYSRYGGRGINVCERWQSFEDFYADMGDRPEGKSLERIDNNGDYSPENVVWADAKAQANNRRSNVILEHNGEKKTMQQWADQLGVKIQTIWARIDRGWTVDRALTQEVRNVLV